LIVRFAERKEEDTSENRRRGFERRGFERRGFGKIEREEDSPRGRFEKGHVDIDKGLLKKEHAEEADQRSLIEEACRNRLTMIIRAYDQLMN